MDIILHSIFVCFIFIPQFWQCGLACSGGFPGCCSDFPALPDFFSLLEDTQPGHVVYSFKMNMEGISLSLEPVGSEPGGYLVLDTQADSSVIYLNHSLDLNLLNPHKLKRPVTDENVTCTHLVNTDHPLQVKRDVTYSLSCKYSDTTNPISAGVFVSVVPVNTNPPQFYCAPYEKNISELTPVGTIVFRMTGLTYDPDIEGGIETLHLVESEYFEATDNRTGEVVTKKLLDYDRGIQAFELELRVMDRGGLVSYESWTSLRLLVQDADDQVPVFSEAVYRMRVKEGLTTRSQVTTRVQAYDQDYGINATVLYSIPECCVPFDINETTGEILVTDVLDREQNASYYFQVQGYQADDPVTRSAFAFVSVLVEDVNDNRPVMGERAYKVNISEHVAVGSIIATVSARDMDTGANAVFVYHLKGANGLFLIDGQSGKISVNDSDQLDREYTDTFIVEIFAQETLTMEKYRSEISEVIIHLSDINDNNPVFTNNGLYVFQSHVQIYTGDRLGKVEAADGDIGKNGEVRYSLVTDLSDSELKYAVYIDPQSGWLVASRSMLVSINSTITVLVEAQDQPSLPASQRYDFAVVEITFANESISSPNPLTTEFTTQGSSTVVTDVPCVCPVPTTLPDPTTSSDSENFGFVITIGILVIIMLILLLIIIVLLLSRHTHVHRTVDKGSLTEPCHVSYMDTASLVQNEQVHTLFSQLEDESSTDGPSKCPTISTFSQELLFTSSLRSSKVDSATNTDCSQAGYRDLFIQFDGDPTYSSLCHDVLSCNVKHTPSQEGAIISGSKSENLDFSDCRAEEVIDIDIPCDSPRDRDFNQCARSSVRGSSQSISNTASQSSDHTGVTVLCTSTHSTWDNQPFDTATKVNKAHSISKEQQEADLEVTEICLLDDVLSAEEESVPAYKERNNHIGELEIEHAEQKVTYPIYTDALRQYPDFQGEVALPSLLESAVDDSCGYSCVHGPKKKHRINLDDVCFNSPELNDREPTNVHQTTNRNTGPITFL